MNEDGEVTLLLEFAAGGDSAARSRLIDMVHAELRNAAGRFMKGERNEHTLQPTALVNEAYIRLFASQREIQNRHHFFALASQAMRSVLVDYARAHRAAKRGCGEYPVPLEENHALAFSDPEELIALNDALDKLEELNPRCARVVEMRFFGGLTESEIADFLQVTGRTVARDWSFARAFLRREMS